MKTEFLGVFSDDADVHFKGEELLGATKKPVYRIADDMDMYQINLIYNDTTLQLWMYGSRVSGFWEAVESVLEERTL